MAQQPRTASRDSAAVVAVERAWIGARDSTTLGRVLAKEFMHLVATGDVIDRDENIAWAATHPLPPGIRPTFASLAVRVYDNTAVATGVVRTVDGTRRELARVVFTDVFVLRDGRWQAVNAQETPVHGTTSAQ